MRTQNPPLAHRGDPDTSHEAAAGITPDEVGVQMQAILDLLAEEPRDDRELVEAYFRNAERNQWPMTMADSVIKRRSQLTRRRPALVEASHKHVSRFTGKKVTVWKRVAA